MKRLFLLDRESDSAALTGVMRHGARADTRPESASLAGTPSRLAEGLCATCAHAGRCAFRQRNRQPVWFCEEFEPDHEEAAAGVAPVVLERDAPGAALRDPGGCAAKGLCLTCRHRESCALPKPESGVWHCQEFE